MNKCEHCHLEKDELDLLTTPCGFNVCRKHFGQKRVGDNFQCLICKDHYINMLGFGSIKKNVMRRNKIRLCNGIKKAYNLMDDLNKFCKDPSFFVNQKTSKILQNVDLEREKMKKSLNSIIDEYYVSIIENLKKKECEELDKIKKIKIDFDQFKNYLNGEKNGNILDYKNFDELLQNINCNIDKFIGPLVKYIDSFDKIQFHPGSVGSNTGSLSIFFGKISTIDCSLSTIFKQNPKLSGPVGNNDNLLIHFGITTISKQNPEIICLSNSPTNIFLLDKNIELDYSSLMKILLPFQRHFSIYSDDEN